MTLLLALGNGVPNSSFACLSMEFIASALGSIPALFWGERAIAALGVRLVCDDYMLVIDDADFDDAGRQLRLEGFQDWAWSYGSVDPSFYTGRLKGSIYRRIVHDFSNLDGNSTRFVFPLEQQQPQHSTAKVALLRSSYAHVCVRSALNDALTRHCHILYPDGALLLQSFVQTLLRDPMAGIWTWMLEMWAISYVYGELMLSDDTWTHVMMR
ncbi:Uncharacterized protein TCAP_06259, partial [Tolypocladium capitatum]